MLFHLGALWRLNDAGLLRGLVRVSSVSGGSITAGVLGLAWNRLQFNDGNISTNLKELLIDPIRHLADDTIDQGSIIKGILLPRKTSLMKLPMHIADIFSETQLSKICQPTMKVQDL